LRGVEDREALEERDRGGVLAGLAGAALLVLRREAVGIDDGGAAFAPRTLPPSDRAWRKVSQLWPGKPCWITAPQRISTLIPE
jgi:hypothetical protein